MEVAIQLLASLSGKRPGAALISWCEYRILEAASSSNEAVRVCSGGLLFLAMGFVVFVGNIMGDCEPGPGCHDNDGAHILRDLLWALVITLSIGAGSWLVSGISRMILQPSIGSVKTNSVLVVLTALIVWFCFDPAMELLLAITARAGE